MEKNENNNLETPGEKQAKPDQKLLSRVVIGFSLAGFSVALIFWGTLPFSLEVLTLAIIGVIEFYKMSERKNIRPSRGIGILSVILILTLTYFGRDKYIPTAMVGLVMISMLGYLFRKGFHVSSFLDVGVTILGVLYVGWFFSYLIHIRKIQGDPFYTLGLEIERGAGFVLLLIFITHFTDIGAFVVGKAIGKHKMAPHISPNKTMEGAAGGIMGSILGAFLIGIPLKISGSDLLTLGIICGVFAQLGDMWESILKRDVKIKDSGGILGSHGGVLDRFDSLLFTAPIFYYYIAFFYK